MSNWDCDSEIEIMWACECVWICEWVSNWENVSLLCGCVCVIVCNFEFESLSVNEWLCMCENVCKSVWMLVFECWVCECINYWVCECKYEYL